MFGFLFKLLIVAGIVFAILFIVASRQGIPITELPQKYNLAQLPNLLEKYQGQIKEVDSGVITRNLSQVLDSLVTHPERNSPIVLGVKVTNESLGTLVDVIQKLPTDQLVQLQTAVCAIQIPTSTPSGTPTN